MTTALHPKSQEPLESLGRLCGLGPKSSALLRRAGVQDAAELRASDPVALYLRARALDAGASLNLLWAIVGAQTDTDWRVVADVRRSELLTRLSAAQEAQQAQEVQVAQAAQMSRAGATAPDDFALTAPSSATTGAPVCSPRNWIAVASAEHARRGRDHPGLGFMQVCHGQRAPLARVRPGDRVAYYAPAETQGGKDGLQSFVSLGVVQPGSPYAFDMGAGFVPYRRDVRYLSAREAPIAGLLDAFEFVEDRRRWGAKFRFGLFAVSDADMRLIARAMAADHAALGL